MKKTLIFFGIIFSVHILAADIVDGQTYKISVSSGKVITVRNSSLTPATGNTGNDVVLWTETKVNAQRWNLIKTADDFYQLRNAYTGNIMYRANNTVNDGVTVRQNIPNANANGKWTITPVEGKDGFFHITQQSGGATYYLETPSNTDGAGLQINPAKTGVNAVLQEWKLEQVTPEPDCLTAAVREEMMARFKARHYRSPVNYTGVTSPATRARIGGGSGSWPGGWWSDAEIFEVVLDAYETTGNPEYEDMIKKLYTDFTWSRTGGGGNLDRRNGTDWMYNEYNDDIAWGVLVAVRLFLMFGDQTYLDIAKDNFDQMYSRAKFPASAGKMAGLLRWKERDATTANATNSCINGPAGVAACYLAIATGDDTYNTKAKELYDLQRQLLYNPATGQVYDSYNGNTGEYNYWASTYNQGTFLGAAVMLYNRYGGEQYKEDAGKIMEFTRSSYFCDANGIIKACDVANGDLAGFKGILMRYVRRYIVDICPPDYAEWVTWMQKNAFHTYNNRNSAGITSSAWLYKAAENFILSNPPCNNNCSFAADPFGPSTSVSAAFNAHLDRKLIMKDAFYKIEAEHFDYIKGVHVKTGTDDATPELGNINPGFHTGYHNVDFGNNLAQKVEVRASKARVANTSIEIRVNSYDGTLIGSIPVPVTGDDWQTLSCDLTQPVGGKQNIYLVFKNTGNTATNMLDVNYFRFKTDSYIYPDITDYKGIISSSHADGGLQGLIDGNLFTKYHTPCNARETVTITYQSPVPVLLKGYALMAANDAPEKDPKAWKLEASSNGTEWIALDNQSNQVFTSRYQKKQNDIATTHTYTWFRLSISERNGSADGFQLAEWQLYGGGLFENDITADGGTLTAQYAGNEPDETYIRLTDKDLATGYKVTGQTNLSFEYQAKALYHLSYYSITSAATPEEDPKDWELYGSIDGNNWTLIDERANQQFSYRKVTQPYPCRIEEGFTHFKLQITANGGSSSTQLTEWQLVGEYYYDRFYNDITANGGKLTSSQHPEANSASLETLTDNDAYTSYPLNAWELPVWIQYESTMPVQLRGYSITGGDDITKTPGSWTLQGSNNGTDWALVASRSNIAFDLKGERKAYDLPINSNKYSYFRLTVSATNGAGQVELAEWELHGTGLSAESFTNNGGNITAQYAGLSGSETVNRLIDNLENTKYRTNFSSSAWVQYQSPTPVKVTIYGITAANDNPTRDPKAWTLEASNNGTDWSVIDARDDQVFSHRYATQYYDCNEDGEMFTYFRLNMTANNGADQLQLSEWQLLPFVKHVYPTTIQTPKSNGEMYIYPNPVNDFFNVSMPEDGQLQIFNVSGQLLHFQRLEKGISTIQVNDYAKGMYIVRIKSDSKIVTGRLIKQ